MKREDHPVYAALASGARLFGGTESGRALVLSHGRAFSPAPLPRGLRRRKAKNCYGNCNSVVLDKRYPDLRYVEGFAMHSPSGIVMGHAWLTRDGEAFDVTWHDLNGINNQDSLYFGVELPTLIVAKAMIARGYAGALDPVDDLILSAFQCEIV